MAEATTASLVTDAIRNPAEPGHFMQVRPVPRRVRVYYGEVLLADTIGARRLLESAKKLYDPVLYLPRADITDSLRKADKTTHCPLKGDSTYYDLVDARGDVVAEQIAWSYDAPFDFADAIARLVAFDVSQVTIVESPA